MLFRSGHLREARTLFEELIVCAPDEPQLQYELGMLCMELSDNPAAYSHFRELVRIQPAFLEGQMLLGMICAELGRLDDAIEHLQQVVNVCPDLSEVHHRLGQVFAEKRCFDEAYKQYQEVLRITPEHTGVLCSIGVLLTTTGQIAEARKVLLDLWRASLNRSTLSTIWAGYVPLVERMSHCSGTGEGLKSSRKTPLLPATICTVSTTCRGWRLNLSQNNIAQ